MSHHLFTTRREFLSGGLTLLSAASTLPVFLGSTVRALAQEPAEKKGPPERILVVVQLAGGNDGLNTVVPVGADAYYKARPRLAIKAKDALTLADGLGLNSAAEDLKAIFDDGRMAVVQGVGYPNPNRSHFVSTDIWHTADPEQRRHEGWIGRYFDNCCKGSDPDPLQGIALTQEAPLAMQGKRFMPMALEDPDTLSWRAGKRDRDALATFEKLNNLSGDLPAGQNSVADFLQRAALKAQLGAAEIRSAAGASDGRRPRRRGGGEFSRSMELVAKMIAADLPTRIYYVSMGGFDTHTGQDARHRRLLTEFGAGMRDFLDTLTEHKLLDQVLVMTFSEFGRRVEENASGGTDHGQAAPMFLFGSKVIPGVHGKHPSLDALDRGDLAFTCDFRKVYSSVLADWLKTRPDAILGRGHGAMKLVRPA